MWDIIIVGVIIAAAAAYALYRFFAKPSCGCGCDCGARSVGASAGKTPACCEQHKTQD